MLLNKPFFNKYKSSIVLNLTDICIVVHNQEQDEQDAPDEITEVCIAANCLQHIVESCLQALQREHGDENINNRAKAGPAAAHNRHKDREEHIGGQPIIVVG